MGLGYPGHTALSLPARPARRALPVGASGPSGTRGTWRGRRATAVGELGAGRPASPLARAGRRDLRRRVRVARAPRVARGFPWHRARGGRSDPGQGAWLPRGGRSGPRAGCSEPRGRRPEPQSWALRYLGMGARSPGWPPGPRGLFLAPAAARVPGRVFLPQVPGARPRRELTRVSLFSPCRNPATIPPPRLPSRARRAPNKHHI